MRTSLVIPAAGSGQRFGSDVPKQFLPLLGVSLLAHSLRAFAGLVDEAVISGSQENGTLLEAVVREAAVDFPVTVVLGGRTRMHSVASALDRAQGAVVLVHDAVRPLVPRPCIAACLKALASHACAVVAVPCAATVKRVADGVVVETVDRTALWLAQTPQGFQRAIGVQAFARAIGAGWACSDDMQVLERCGHQPVIVPGDPRNLKITTRDDLALAQALMSLPVAPIAL